MAKMDSWCEAAAGVCGQPRLLKVSTDRGVLRDPLAGGVVEALGPIRSQSDRVSDEAPLVGIGVPRGEFAEWWTEFVDVFNPEILPNRVETHAWFAGQALFADHVGVQSEQRFLCCPARIPAALLPILYGSAGDSYQVPKIARIDAEFSTKVLYESSPVHCLSPFYPRFY